MNHVNRLYFSIVQIFLGKMYVTDTITSLWRDLGTYCNDNDNCSLHCTPRMCWFYHNVSLVYYFYVSVHDFNHKKCSDVYWKFSGRKYRLVGTLRRHFFEFLDSFLKLRRTEKKLQKRSTWPLLLSTVIFKSNCILVLSLKIPIPVPHPT